MTHSFNVLCHNAGNVYAEYITYGGCDSGNSTGRGVGDRRHYRTREPRKQHHAAAGLQGPPPYSYHALSQSKAREKQPEKFYFSLRIA